MNRKNYLFFNIVAILCILIWISPLSFYINVDWGYTLYHVAVRTVSGENPYEILRFFNPPWVLLVLIPFTLLPYALGFVALYLVNLASFIFVFKKLGLSYFSAIAILCSGAILNSQMGNIEGLVSLGLLFFPQIGLFFLLAKPQIGIGVALLIAVKAYEKNGLWEVVETFLPVCAAFAMSFAFFGNYMTSAATVPWNTSLFPWLLPFGIISLYYIVFKKSLGAALALGVFISPYIAIQSWLWLVFGICVFVERREWK